MRDCCVQECEEHEIPRPWREQDKLAQQFHEQLCEGEAAVDRRWVVHDSAVPVTRGRVGSVHAAAPATP
jgi:hypothetical protein